MIQSLFIECACQKEQVRNGLFIPANNDQRDFFTIPIAKFAYPEEKVTKWECHDRTKRIAGKMRSLTELIPTFILRQIVLELIDELSDWAHGCCEKEKHWTECLGPIADAWQKLDDTWDQLGDIFKKGLNVKKFLTTPNNL